MPKEDEVRVTLRLPPVTHAELKRISEAQRRSLNNLIVLLLDDVLFGKRTPQSRADALFGKRTPQSRRQSK